MGQVYRTKKKACISSIPVAGNIFRICKYLSNARCTHEEASLLHVTYPAVKRTGISTDSFLELSYIRFR
jgi:hypothetical protein